MQLLSENALLASTLALECVAKTHPCKTNTMSRINVFVQKTSNYPASRRILTSNVALRKKDSPPIGCLLFHCSRGVVGTRTSQHLCREPRWFVAPFLSTSLTGPKKTTKGVFGITRFPCSGLSGRCAVVYIGEPMEKLRKWTASRAPLAGGMRHQTLSTPDRLASVHCTSCGTQGYHRCPY